MIGIILLIGIVKKNAIMMIDFALEAERNEGKPPHEAIYQACLLRFRPIMMTTMAALLGGIPLALGTGRVGTAPAARHRDRRRLDRQPDPDAVHDAGGLSGFRPAGARLSVPQATVPRRTREVLTPESHMSLSAPFIQRPVATSLLTSALALAGVICLPVAARRAASPGGISHDQRLGAACRARARKPWPFGRNAARTPVRAHRRRHRDDVEHARLDQITLQFELSRDIDAAARDVQAAINAARGQSARESAEQSDLSQGQSGRCADPDPGADVRHVRRAADVRRGRFDSGSRSCRRSKASAR